MNTHISKQLLPYLAIIAILTVTVAGVARYSCDDYNNYTIFASSFGHLLQQLNLYTLYPAEYYDQFLYGPVFTLLIAPFSLLPSPIGMVMWLIANTALLIWGSKRLKMSDKQQCWMIVMGISELFLSASMQQFNIGICALIILSFTAIERKQEFWAAFFIMLGAMTKIYGIVGLAFFFFSKDKPRLILSMLFWGGVLLVAPMILTSSEYVISQYREWILTLANKNEKNLTSFYQNISTLGMVRKISGHTNYSDLIILIPAMILFAIPYLRWKQFRYPRFRMLILASTLIFVVIFSSGSESVSYITAIMGVSIWFFASPAKYKWVNLSLLLFTHLIITIGGSDLCPGELKITYILGYALKSLPCLLVWLWIQYELISMDFKHPKELPTHHDPHEALFTLVLPCYNPPTFWQSQMQQQLEVLKQSLTQWQIRLIVVNDGSKRGFTDNDIALFHQLMPQAQLISLPLNSGKGAAVRAGISQAQSYYIIYTDYDFPYQISSVAAVLSQLQQNADVVTVRRNNSYHHNKRLNPFRRFLSITSRFVNRWMLGIRFNDSQAGLKGMNSKGKEILLHTQINSFLFDTEFIYKASCTRDLNIKQVEVDLREGVYFSTMGGKVFVKECSSLIKILFTSPK